MPVDEAIFTGKITEAEFKHERLIQFNRLEKQKDLKKLQGGSVIFVRELFDQVVCSTDSDHRANHGWPYVLGVTRLGYLTACVHTG